MIKYLLINKWILDMRVYISGVSDSIGVKEASFGSKPLAIPSKMGYLDRALAWIASFFSCFWSFERKAVDLTKVPEVQNADQDTFDADCGKMVKKIMKDCAIKNRDDFFSNIKNKFYYHEFMRTIKELHPSGDPDAWIAKSDMNHQPTALIV
jgi:hypothetical protein